MTKRFDTPLEISPLIEVSNLPGSIEFYTKKLGFSLVEQSEFQGRIDWCLKLNCNH